jgi:hypothetical protein
MRTQKLRIQVTIKLDSEQLLRRFELTALWKAAADLLP